jgi:hypothetical protein
MDQATLLKLYLSRDAHAESNRKIFGAAVCEKLTGGDPNREKMNLHELIVISQREQMHSAQSEGIAEPTLRPIPSKACDIERLVSELNDLSNSQPLSRKVTPVFDLNAELVDIERPFVDDSLRNNHTYMAEFAASSSFSSSAAPSDVHSPIPTGSTDSYDYSPSSNVLPRETSNTFLTIGYRCGARHPVIAKRNPQIDKMITDAVQQRSSFKFKSRSSSLNDVPINTNNKLAASSTSPESSAVTAGSGHSKKMEQRFTTRFPTKTHTPNSPLTAITREEQEAVRIEMTRNLHNQLVRTLVDGKG